MSYLYPGILGPKFGPVGRQGPRGHLPHEAASPGGGRMPHLRHSWCFKPTRGHTQYCRHCFGVGQQCQCMVAPHQAPGPATALWMPPIVSYVAMASSTETTVSTSTVGAAPLGYPTSAMPPLEPMEMLPPLPREQLLLMAGIGRGGRGRTLPQTPTAPGLRQPRPRMPQPQVPAPGRQGATAQTPYQQQVFPPLTPAPRPRATPSASQSQGRERPADEETEARGRSSSQGPQNR